MRLRRHRRDDEGGESRAPRRRASGEAGFGLIESVIALGVLIAILVSTSYVVDTVSDQASTARERVTATELAEQWMETLANDPLTTLQSDMNHDVTLATPDISGVTYTVVSYLDWSGTGLAPSLCLSGSPPQVIRTSVTVNWEVTNTLTETTIINPPYGTASPGDGFLSVQIIGATGSGPPGDVTNVPVVIDDGPEGADETYTPDTNGCVFREESPGTYSVTLGQPKAGPAFADNQEDPVLPATCTYPASGQGCPSASATVVEGLTASTSFHYDQASVVQFQSGGAPVAATNLPVSVGNDQLTPLPWRTVIPAGSQATSAALFPYASGYSVWYGDCTAEEPASPTQISTSPGVTTTATIGGLATLVMAVTNSSTSNPVSGATATATVADPNAATDGCAADTFGLTAANSSGDSSTALPVETYNVTVTDPSNGDTTTVSLQVTSTSVIDGQTTYPDGTPVPVSVG